MSRNADEDVYLKYVCKLLGYSFNIRYKEEGICW